MKRRCITGEEHDVHTAWRKLLCRFERAGKASQAKRRTRRRERREGKAEIQERMEERSWKK